MSVRDGLRESAVWEGLGLSQSTLTSLPPHAATSTSLRPSDAVAALSRAAHPRDFSADTRAAAASFVEAARGAAPRAAEVRGAAPRAADALDALVAALDAAEAAVRGAEARVGDVLRGAAEGGGVRRGVERDAQFVEAFVGEVVLEPGLVRHVVDGEVGGGRYVECLGVLRKKRAVLGMVDAQGTRAGREIRPVLAMLVETAAAKVQEFLLRKMYLLRAPGTNVQIVKESVLLRHVELSAFLEEMAPASFAVVRDEYTDVMATLYTTLFTRYSSALMGRKADVGADGTAGALASSSSAAVAAAASGISLSSAPLVGVPQVKPAAGGGAAATLSSFFGGGSGGGSVAVTGSGGGRLQRSVSVTGSIPGSPVREDERRNAAVDATNAAGAAAKASGRGSLFSLGNRIDVLAKVDSPAVVLAVAENNDLTFYHEEILRSLGRMLSETCASEHAFCAAFFGGHASGMFHVLFDKVVGVLLEAVALHASVSHDIVGALLALKVNEAQRTSMQHRNISDLSHYFIRVDIALKPKFKRLFDANVASLHAAAAAPTLADAAGEAAMKPHPVTRQFAELSSAILAIAAYGATDDAVQDGLRRMRAEMTGFLTALSARFPQTKARYIFLVNNIDVVLSTYAARGVNSVADARFFNELQVGHIAAYVEHEVGDHFPDVVAFVRDYERRARQAAARPGAPAPAGPSESHVRKVLREFANNWHLGVGHMRDGVLRSFPNFKIGNDILRALFARLLAYHRRCETAVNEQYAPLRGELVSSTEISFEVRQLSKPIA